MNEKKSFWKWLWKLRVEIHLDKEDKAFITFLVCTIGGILLASLSPLLALINAWLIPLPIVVGVLLFLYAIYRAEDF